MTAVQRYRFSLGFSFLMHTLFPKVRNLVPIVLNII